MENLNYQVFLKSIQYSGDDIGDDWDITIRTAGKVSNFQFMFKQGEEKVFEEAELLVEKELKRKKGVFSFNLMIKAIELDIKPPDDEQQDHFKKKFKIIPGKIYEFSQKVKIEETSSRRRKNKKTAILLFNFENRISKDVSLPDTFPPITLPLIDSISIYGRNGSGHCDPVCIQKCGTSIPCIIACCR